MDLSIYTPTWHRALENILVFQILQEVIHLLSLFVNLDSLLWLTIRVLFWICVISCEQTDTSR